MRDITLWGSCGVQKTVIERLEYDEDANVVVVSCASEVPGSGPVWGVRPAVSGRCRAPGGGSGGRAVGAARRGAHVRVR